MLVNPPNDLAAAAPGVAATPLAPSSAMLIALALLAPFFLYLGTAQSLVTIWNSSETFAHGYAILPISLWLIWRRRAVFNAVPARPWAPALLLLAMLGAGWLLARMGEVQVVMQYAFVSMFPVIALAMLGPRLAGALAFPLLFLLLAVPFGEVFVGPLINLTADFTVWAVQATGIPVLRNGTRFELPTGSWSVVEACSGVRYLISSFTLGCLYAYLTYRSTKKRLLFVAVSIVVPIIANGLRAYMIVMIGHLSGMELATGVDHLIYGWVFFGLVMLLMFWVGSFWRDDDELPVADAATTAAATVPGNPAPASMARMAAMCAAVVALTAVWPGFARYNDAANLNPQPVQLSTVAVSWPQVAPFASWTPRWVNPDATYRATFRNSESMPPVALDIMYYRNQRNGKALISSVNTLATSDDAWHAVGGALRSETLGGQPLTLRETRLNGPGGQILVWQWMSIDGHLTANNYVGKLLQAQAKLRFRGDDGAVVLLSAPVRDNPEAARAALRAFLAGQGQAVERALDHARTH
ncbi:exosortase A [Massilia sp. CFBP9012]|uniref:exosortase A n=1 Tax=Massilia sp. CFBP9012 TaxID=3096531 RepID=UPI002A6A30F0|nr:exosortase A [Massilia sp. CFBP9012]MDY0974409.1 exosortase A [Massilia sp. CFBP9012]